MVRHEHHYLAPEIGRRTRFRLDPMRQLEHLSEALATGARARPVVLGPYSFLRLAKPAEPATDPLHHLDALVPLYLDLVSQLVDEPALREGLPLRARDRGDYLRWAVEAFRLATGAVADTTQVHTHMCYADLAEIAEPVADLDADVLSLATARSALAPLDALGSDYRSASACTTCTRRACPRPRRSSS